MMSPLPYVELVQDRGDALGPAGQAGRGLGIPAVRHGGGAERVERVGLKAQNGRKNVKSAPYRPI